MAKITLTGQEVLNKEARLRMMLSSTEKMNQAFLFDVDRIHEKLESNVKRIQRASKPKGKHAEYEKECQNLLKGEHGAKDPANNPQMITYPNGRSVFVPADGEKWEEKKKSLWSKYKLDQKFFDELDEAIQELMDKKIEIEYTEILLSSVPKDIQADHMQAIGCFIKDDRTQEGKVPPRKRKK